MIKHSIWNALFISMLVMGAIVPSWPLRWPIILISFLWLTDYWLRQFTPKNPTTATNPQFPEEPISAGDEEKTVSQSIQKSTVPTWVLLTSLVVSWFEMVIPFSLALLGVPAIVWYLFCFVTSRQYGLNQIPSVTEFQLQPDWTTLFLWAYALWYLISLPFTRGAIHLLLGRQKYLEYLKWDSRNVMKQPLPKMTVWISSAIGLVALVTLWGIGFWLWDNWYARFNPDGIVIRQPLAYRNVVHPYSTIEDMVVSSHRRRGFVTEESPQLSLRFQNGTQLVTEGWFELPHDSGERMKLLQYLKDKTGKEIREVRLLNDDTR